MARAAADGCHQPLVLAHEPGISGYVGSQDRRKPSLDALFGHRSLSLRCALEAKFYAGVVGESMRAELWL